MSSIDEGVTTFPYKYVGNEAIYLDVYPPPVASRNNHTHAVPTVVYFHGGGLTVGNRRSWFPEWLKRQSELDLWSQEFDVDSSLKGASMKLVTFSYLQTTGSSFHPQHTIL
jgi:hypothetical protein